MRSPCRTSPVSNKEKTQMQKRRSCEEKHNLPKLTYEATENLNKPITTKKIKTLIAKSGNDYNIKHLKGIKSTPFQTLPKDLRENTS